jgi:hypothetical protein
MGKINATRSFAFPAVLVVLGLALMACSTPSTDSTPSPSADLTPGTGSAPAQSARVPPPPSLPDLGPAPDFTNEVWINAESPLTLGQLRGKVVLVEFWTF